MAAPELLQYISQSKAAGFTEAQIQTALRTAGWAEEAITEAFSGTTAITPSPSPAATAPNAPANTEAELARIQSELEEAKKKFHPHADQ